MSRRRGIVVFAATSIVLLAGSLAVLVSKNTAGVNHQYKFASYATVESVAGASDTVLRGSVSGDASTFYDNGGFPSENANDGDRLRVVPVRVTSVFKGSESPGAQILVLQPDWEGNQSIPLAKGDDVILFVQRFVRPDIEKTFGGGRVYSQVGENASVFDVLTVALSREKSRYPPCRSLLPLHRRMPKVALVSRSTKSHRQPRRCRSSEDLRLSNRPTRLCNATQQATRGLPTRGSRCRFRAGNRRHRRV